ncbi:hypothetical protein ACIQOW_04150 [Kitasatospora sp. NPDC091335]
MLGAAAETVPVKGGADNLTLTVTGDSSYRRRFVGHIENGEESVSG